MRRNNIRANEYWTNQTETNQEANRVSGSARKRVCWYRMSVLVNEC